jgi:hypothetical protein
VWFLVLRRMSHESEGGLEEDGWQDTNVCVLLKGTARS